MNADLTKNVKIKKTGFKAEFLKCFARIREICVHLRPKKSKRFNVLLRRKRRNGPVAHGRGHLPQGFLPRITGGKDPGGGSGHVRVRCHISTGVQRYDSLEKSR